MTRPMEASDLSLLIGVLAICQGQIMVGSADAVASHLLQRWQRQGLVGSDATERDVPQVLADLCERVRYAKGEYEEPPTSTPIGQ